MVFSTIQHTQISNSKHMLNRHPVGKTKGENTQRVRPQETAGISGRTAFGKALLHGCQTHKLNSPTTL